MTFRRGRLVGEPRPDDLSRVADVIITRGSGEIVVVSASAFRRSRPLATDAHRRRWRLLSRKARAKAP